MVRGDPAAALSKISPTLYTVQYLNYQDVHSQISYARTHFATFIAIAQRSMDIWYIFLSGVAGVMS